MNLDEHVQLEFPFTKTGYMQERAMKQDKYLRQSWEVNNMYLYEANLPLMTFNRFEMSDTGSMYMNFFRQVYPYDKEGLL